MTWTVAASGTLTATIGTESTLTTQTTNATYALKVDLSNMALGDVTELRIYSQVLSTGSVLVAWKSTYGPSTLITPISFSPFVPSDLQIKATLKQVAGTARSFPWSLLSQ